MKKNIGMIDRVIRIVVALVIVFLFVDYRISLGLSVFLFSVAAIFALTSLIGSCPLYLPFGIDTNQKSTNK